MHFFPQLIHSRVFAIVLALSVPALHLPLDVFDINFCVTVYVYNLFLSFNNNRTVV